MGLYTTTHDHEEHTRLVPTRTLRAWEFVRGSIAAIPMSLFAVFAIFGVDLLNAFDRAPQRVQGLSATMAIIVFVCAVLYGAYRSFRIIFWEFDGRRNIVRFQTRSWSGMEGTCYESPLQDVEALTLTPNQEKPRSLSIQIQGAPELFIARNWLRSNQEMKNLYDDIQRILETR